ncbi:MAG: DUF4159 domain-containing protein [Lentisphaerae bacterium]|jgi:hypothetical protein|nr:DUF4159 domain-containing protein [Lentisphaerota bacterium]
MSKNITVSKAILCLITTVVVFAFSTKLNAAIIFSGDGSDEPGFVAPPMPKAPPPPPANMAGGETFIPYPGPPAQPQSRSEKKRPPRPPVMFTKLKSQYGDIDWNARPNDLNNLLNSLKAMADVNYDSENKTFAQINPDPEQNPILYRTGHFHWHLTTAEKAKLREYLLRGGTIILNAGMGSKPFYDSARRIMEEIFPEAPVQRLSADHAVFHSYYDIDQVEYRKGVRASGYTSNEPWLEGVTIDCRTVCFISRFGMESGWDPYEDDNILAYAPESAQRLGMNIVSYATTIQNWAKQVAKRVRYEDAENVTTAASMNIAQVIYEGEWKTRHVGLSMLLKEFNRKTDVPVKFASRDIRLTDSKLFDTPVLYVTGHDAFHLKPEEIAALRTYLTNGGILVGEACCGRSAFDRSFRDLMKVALPGANPEAPSKGHAIYLIPNKITQMTPTDALKQITGKSLVDPELIFWKSGDNVAVIYSPRGLAGGWELAQNPYSLGYTDSLLLGENILMYLLTR